MRIKITSVFVDDQQKALTFYTEVLGFVKNHRVKTRKHGAAAGNIGKKQVVIDDQQMRGKPFFSLPEIKTGRIGFTAFSHA